MRRRTQNLIVPLVILAVTLSFVAVLPVTSQNTGLIISKLEELRRKLEGEHPALEGKVKAVIHQIEAGAFNGALNKLQNDVRKSITAWVDNPEELIKLVNEIIDLIAPPPLTPNFEITANPTELEVVQGSFSISTITVTSKYNFTQEVILTNATLATGITLSLNPITLTPPPNGSATSTLRVEATQDAQTGRYTITVTGTSGSIHHDVEIKLDIVAPDFEIKAEPNELTIEQGSSDSSLITVTSLWGFNKRVNLSLELAPTTDRIALSLEHTWVVPTPDGNTSTLTVVAATDAEPREYTITVYAKSDSLEHSAKIKLMVIVPAPTPDFSITASPTTLKTQKGDSNASLIIVTSLQGFNQQVDLAVTSTPISRVTSSLNPMKVIPPADSFAISMLTVDVAVDALLGSYKITITGTNGTTVHSTNITLEVTEPEIHPPPPPDFSVIVYPATLTIEQGDSATSTIITASLNGFTQSVDLAITTAPIPGVTTILDPSQVIPAPNGFVASTMKISVEKTATPDDYVITVAGTNGTLQRTASISLKIITEKKPPEIHSVMRNPEKPSYNDTVTVLASVSDSVSGIKEVILNYVHATTAKNVTMTLKEGIYAADIETFSYGASVEYRIYASDNVDNWSTSSLYSYVVIDPYSPMIGVPSWWPMNPAANEEITINVTVTEPTGASDVDKVILWYSNTTLDIWKVVPMTFKDGKWTAVLAGQSNTVVEFSVEAFDKAGNNEETELYEITVAAPSGFPLAWILAAIVIIAALIGGSAYYVGRKQKKPQTTLPSAPSAA